MTDGTDGRDDAEPEAAIVVGSREQLLHLLAEAAEIEHTLMCSYLYAAFSLKRRDEAGLTAEQGEAVERWRKAIVGVAVEEMGHLLIVSNLMLAVGGRPHFARPNFPVTPGHFPSEVVVRLSGFGGESLKHFIFLERPQGTEGDDADAFEQPDYDRSQRIEGLMPSAQDYATIAHLYDAIRDNIRSLAGTLGEGGLFVGGRYGQLGEDDIDIAGVERIGSVDGAMRGIDVIVEQGEGSPADRDDSHYRSFCAIRDELGRLTAADAAFAPAWPVADNPVLRDALLPEDACYISHPEAARLLDFACAAYGLLLRALNQAFGRGEPGAAGNRKALIDLSFDLMHVVGAAAAGLARLPASEDGVPGNAGMTFTMLRGVEPLSFGKVETALLKERLEALAGAAARIGRVGEDMPTLLRERAAAFELAMT